MEENRMPVVAPPRSPAGATLSLRPAGEEDAGFLYHLYATTREEELSAVGWTQEQRESFLKMQFKIREDSYAAAFAGLTHHIILFGESKAGRIMVSRAAEEFRLVDIAILPEFQKLGIGTALLAELLREAHTNSLRVRLHVLRTSRAADWYRAHGFIERNDEGLYLMMENDGRHGL